jgi:tetratricopeptide (TPR) repeat protein
MAANRIRLMKQRGLRRFSITVLCAGFIFCGCSSIAKSALKKIEIFELNLIGISIDVYDDTIDIENIAGNLPIQYVVNSLERKHGIKIDMSMFQDKRKIKANTEQLFKSSPLFWTVNFKPHGNNILYLGYSIKTKDKKFSVYADIGTLVKERKRRLLSETIELDWKLIEGYIRGETYERFKLAVEKLNEAILLDPVNASLYHERSKAHAGLGDSMSAFNDANRMILLEPSAENYEFRAAVLAAMEMLTDAVADLSRAIEIDQNRVTPYEIRAKLYGRSGRYKDAIADLTKVIEIDPQNRFAYVNRGAWQINSGQIQNGMDDLDIAMKLDPNMPLAFYWRGSANYLLGNIHEAIRDYDRALEIVPDFTNDYIASLSPEEQEKEAGNIKLAINQEIIAFTYGGLGHTYQKLAEQETDRIKKAEYRKKADENFAIAEIFKQPK